MPQSAAWLRSGCLAVATGQVPQETGSASPDRVRRYAVRSLLSAARAAGSIVLLAYLAAQGRLGFSDLPGRWYPRVARL